MSWGLGQGDEAVGEDAVPFIVYFTPAEGF